MKSESALTRLLIPALAYAMPGAEVLKHSDRFTFGIPDVSVNWRDTCWLEVKATETARLERHKYLGRQLLLCRRLERATGKCWFVVYRETAGVQSVGLWRPTQVLDDGRLGDCAEDFLGFDHASVAQFVKGRMHGHHTA